MSDEQPPPQNPEESQPGDEHQPQRADEQARLEKLLAETALLNAQKARLEREESFALKKAQLEADVLDTQLKKLRRENEAAEAVAQTLSGRYWFIPSPKLALQSIGAGIVLAGAFFFLYQPLVDVARLEGTIGTLGTEIEGMKNEQLSLENQITRAALQRQEQQLKDQKEQLKDQKERYSVELKKLAENLKQNKKQKDASVEFVKDLSQQLTNISAAYRTVAKTAETSETEKGKYAELAKGAEEKASRLTARLQTLEEQARAAKEQATRVQEQIKKLPFRNSIGMEFVLIPAGEFLMGSTNDQDNERPVHQVTISQPFYLGKHEVTQDQWEAVMEDNPSQFSGDSNQPVESVTWNDMQTFIEKLNKRESGRTYRLPTEAEWEYACRAGTTTAYSFGDDPRQLGEYAWYRENSDSKIHPVGQLKPNPWGLYDMHGNVFEWVQDWYDSDSYKQSPDTDPPGPSTGDRRVLRGGYFVARQRGLRCASRDGRNPQRRDADLGFRVVVLP